MAVSPQKRQEIFKLHWKCNKVYCFLNYETLFWAILLPATEKVLPLPSGAQWRKSKAKWAVPQSQVPSVIVQSCLSLPRPPGLWVPLAAQQGQSLAPPPQQVQSPPGPFPMGMPKAGVATVPLLVALLFCWAGQTGLAWQGSDNLWNLSQLWVVDPSTLALSDREQTQLNEENRANKLTASRRNTAICTVMTALP